MASNNPPRTSQDLFGDSDDDDFSDSGKESAPEKEEHGNNEPSETQNEPQPTKPSQTSQDLFGNDDDDDDDDDNDAEFDDTAVVGLPSTTTAGTVLPMASNRNLPMASQTQPQENQTQKYSIPQATKLEDKNKQKLFITKLPNLIGVQPQAFEPGDYLPDLEHQTYGQASDNLMRWRYAKDSNGHAIRDDDTNALVRESNTRLIEWEDGTWSLQIGKEVFAMDQVLPKGEFPGIHGYLYMSQKATDEQNAPAGTVLECVHAMAGRMTARPSSLQSEAHKALTVSIRQKTLKQSRIQEFATINDPEQIKAERIRAKNDIEKEEARKQSKRKSYGSYPRMSRQYLEEDDEAYDTFNVRSAKRSARDEDLDDYGDDESFGEHSSGSSDEDIFNRGAASKDKKEVQDVVMGDVGSDDDDVVAAPKPVATHRAVLDDEDSD